MELGINLLKKRAAISQKQLMLEKKTFYWSLGVFGVVVVSTIVIFVMNLLATRNLETTEAEIKKLNAEFMGMQDVNIKQLYLKSRLALIGEFFDSRVSSREALQRIFSIDLDGVNIGGVSFESDTLVSLQLDSKNINSLDLAYNYFGNEEKFFTQVINKGVSRTDEGEYVMQLKLNIPESEVKSEQ